MPASPSILSLDTSSDWCSVALLLPDGRLQSIAERAGHGHSRRVLEMVDELLTQHGLAPADCDAIAFGAGPGAFTGLRIACGVAQGLAFGADRPVIAVDGLAAIAEGAAAMAGEDRVDLAVAIDARMGECYFGWFACESGRPSHPDIASARLGKPAATAEALLAAVRARPDASVPVILAGDGPSLDPEAFAPLRALALDLAPPAFAHAESIARLAVREFLAGRARPAADAHPLYVRDKVALDVDEQRALRAARDGAAS